MKKRKEKKVALPGKVSFVLHNVFLSLILLVSLCASILDNLFGIVPWPDDYSTVISVSSQIITGIVSLVVSIISIAISLQNEEFFGIKITKLYALRAEKHYSILHIILVSIFLCAINLVFYMLGLTMAAIGTLLVALLFLFKVVRTEIPIMAKDEIALLGILKSNIISCYLSKKEASQDLKEAIKYLLYYKNFKEIYLFFKDNSDKNYNEYLFMKLLEYQQDLAFELKDKYSDTEQQKIGSSLLENVFDVTLRHFDFSEEIYDEVKKNSHLLTRVLFRIHELPATQHMLLGKIRGLFQLLTFSKLSSERDAHFLSSLLIILVAVTVKQGDFSIINKIRCQLSSSDWGIRDASPALDVFALLSMYLYYLCSSEPDVPSDLKEKIHAFITESGNIEENTRIVSWKQLFKTAASKFAVNYQNYIDLYLVNAHSLEYWLYSGHAKFVVLDTRYVSNWYLSHLLNSRDIRATDYSSLLIPHPENKHMIKSFGEQCIDDNKNFVPTEAMIRIISFYDDSNKYFSIFKIIEQRQHTFFNFINQIKLEELKDNTEQARNIDEIRFAESIRDKLESTLKSEWGYDASLAIENEERAFSVLLEKHPDAFNFEESIVDFCVDSVFQDLENATKKTVFYNDGNFENNIRSILSKKLKYATASAKQTIPFFYIQDESLRQLFINVCNPLKEFTSRLLGTDAIVVEQGFSFNCIIEKVEFRRLSKEELSNQVKEYQRADGQYVFHGTFLPKEEITKIIEGKFTVLTVVIKHHVVSSEDRIFDLKPFAEGPLEETLTI